MVLSIYDACFFGSDVRSDFYMEFEIERSDCCVMRINMLYYAENFDLVEYYLSSSDSLLFITTDTCVLQFYVDV